MYQEGSYGRADYKELLYRERGGGAAELNTFYPPQWESVIERLDEYEGCTASDPEPHEYRREVVDAYLPNGKTVPAWAYVLNRLSPGLKEIESGDYLAWRVRTRG